MNLEMTIVAQNSGVSTRRFISEVPVSAVMDVKVFPGATDAAALAPVLIKGQLPDLGPVGGA